MIVAKIQVTGVCATAAERKLITAGIIGAQVQFDYASDPWDGLHKTVVFRGAVTKDVITDDPIVTIPAETVATPNTALRVGVYGVDADGNIAIPTLWADLGNVRDAADPSGDTSTDPTLPVWSQVQQLMTELAEKSAESASAAKEAAEQAAESRDAAEGSAGESAQSAQMAEDAASDAKDRAASAEQAARAAAESKVGADQSADAAAGAASAAQDSAHKAALAQAAAQTALQGMVYVTFAVDSNGHVLIQNGDLLGATVFSLNANGHLEVDY